MLKTGLEDESGSSWKENMCNQSHLASSPFRDYIFIYHLGVNPTGLMNIRLNVKSVP